MVSPGVYSWNLAVFLEYTPVLPFQQDGIEMTEIIKHSLANYAQKMG